MRVMRRVSGLCALVLLLAPLAISVATAAADSEAMRCAIACGHAATDVGADGRPACCPMAGAKSAGAALAACPRSDPQGLAPRMALPPLVLAEAPRLEAPSPGSLPEIPRASVSPATFPRPIDHVPLLLS